ncbi:MAG: hypothetical protein Q4E33_00850 [Erysipelotrichaceae bacterium]|nr:hypothetical protein [Erysipelotrichaceae bacterium]
MLELLFIGLMILIFGRMTIFAIKLTWGFAKVLFVLIFLPIILIIALIVGLVRLAFPVLAIIGLISLFTVR